MSNTPKKKILYVITKSNWGGAQRYVFNLATNLPEKFDVSVALGGNGALKTKLEDAGIRVISLPFLKRDVGATDVFVLKDLVKLFNKEKPDIIHLNSSKIGGLGALAGRIAGVPEIIFTAHGWAFREERPAFQKFIIKFVSWLTILFCHRVITVSGRDAREGRAMPFTKKKISLIHNGLSEPQFLSRTEAQKKILEICGMSEEHVPEDALWIGTIGELHRNKGHMFAVDAIANWNPRGGVLFFIIGEGEERKALETNIRSKGLGRKVNLLGNIHNASEYLRAFDVFLFPSVKEGLPYAVLEAGMAGLTVVASGVGGIPEIIDDMESGMLVRPKSAEEITKSLEFLSAHPERMKLLGAKLSEKVHENFSFEKMKKETLEVYLTA